LSARLGATSGFIDTAATFFTIKAVNKIALLDTRIRIVIDLYPMLAELGRIKKDGRREADRFNSR
jgi:hypothetical protein